MVILCIALGAWVLYLLNSNDKLTVKLNKLEEANYFLGNLNEKNQSKLDTSREEQNKLNQNISDLKNKLDISNSELNELRWKKQGSLQKQLDESKQTIVAKSRTILSLRDEVKMLKFSKEQSKGGVSQESLDKANETIRAANKRISELKAEIAELEKRPSTDPSSIYRDLYNKLQEETVGWKVEIEELKMRLRLAQDRLESVESSSDHTWYSEYMDAKGKLSTLEAQITSIEAENLTTLNKLIDKTKDCEKWEEDYRLLKIRHDNLERNAHNGESNSAELGEVKRKLRTAERNLNRITEERDDYKCRWEELYRKGDGGVDLGEFKQLTVPHILLGLRKGAAKKEVRERIRGLSRFYHPDKGADGVMMKLLNQAANDM